MHYLSMEQYKKAWIFRHRDLPVSDEDLALIKPLTESRSEQIWAEHVSRESTHPEFFTEGDWAADDATWLEGDYWQSAWDRNESDLPELLAAHLKDWDDNTTVYFCYQSDHVIETKWFVFKKHWKNFLFFDNGPLLLGRKRSQVAQFFDNGNYHVGNRA